MAQNSCLKGANSLFAARSEPRRAPGVLRSSKFQGRPIAKIYEARIDYDAVEGIEVAPPQREGKWFWGVLFAVFLIAGATLGLTLATGSFSNAVEVAQAGFAGDGMGDTATN